MIEVNPFVKKDRPSITENSLSKCQKTLGYQFNDVKILIKALTHRSFAHESILKAVKDNERLEFLGDSVLSIVVSDYLVKHFPAYSEGILTKLRANLVNGPSLTEKALKLHLGKFLQLGKGEMLTGGNKRASILASGLEAVIGAIYLDGGLNKAADFVHSLFKNEIKSLSQKKGERNWKGLLQQYTQKELKSQPSYVVIEEKGPEHKKRFVIVVKIFDRLLGKGKGKTKKEAEQQAAKSTLRKYYRHYLDQAGL
ncbi:MAG: ribonuclease III [Candidatus Omnitrophota bacterium]|nr:ribonuclease III [Candidatus Omnitrophota bacterium]